MVAFVVASDLDAWKRIYYRNSMLKDHAAVGAMA
jgi:hypothetical protein